MIVSESFFNVATIAYKLYVKTKGIFNPLVSIARFGYDKNFTDIENSKSFLNESPYNIDFHSVVIDKDTRCIQLMEGQQLDFGGFLKGYLSEMIARKIKLYSGSISGIIVNIGGDIHTEGLDENGNKFMFNIYNPIQGENDVSVVLYNQSLATSGTYKRSWLNSGKKVHHILDISGEKNPESNIISASVIHNNGAISEAYTKVFLSLEKDKAMNLLGDKNISFVIINDNGQVIKK
jgi:thiamine biosynthesis lipoprotein